MSLLFLVPESSYKVFQQSVWTIELHLMDLGLFVIMCQLDKLKNPQKNKTKGGHRMAIEIACSVCFG